MPSNRILQCLPETLSEHGENPAVLAVGENDVESVSYAALAKQVDRLARKLVAAGIEKGDHVALFAGPSEAWIVSCLALIRLGAVPVPLDTQIGDEQLLRIIDDADIDHAFADEPRAERLRDVDFEGEVLRLDDDGGPLPEADAGNADDADFGDPAGDDVALLFFTSGTTGPPKGVPLSHRNLRFQTDAIRDAGIVTPQDRALLPLPLHHVYPLVVGVLVPLSLGIPVILPPALTGPELVRAIRRTNATIIIGVPRLYAALMDAIDSQLDSAPWPIAPAIKAVLALATRLRARAGINAGGVLLAPVRRRLGASLRLLASGGSPLAPALAERLQGLGWDVAVGYGLTETSPILTFNPPGSRRVETVGRPLDGVEIRIDEEAAPKGESDDRNGQGGEILARGPGVFSGYLNLPEKTDKAFTDGWYRTGDLGWIDDDGYLHVSGRKSTMLVTASGENVSTETLEDSYREHELIEDIGILKSDEALVGIVYPDSSKLDGSDDSQQAEIEQAISERARSLPSWQRLDRILVTRQPLEKTRLGKLKRHKLEERLEALESGEEDDAAEPMAIADMAPEDRRRLRNDAPRKAWELLSRRFPDKPLSPDSNVRMDLGIDSLGWLDLTMDIARETGIELKEDAIARIETVRDLLDVLADRKASTGDLKTPLEEPRKVLSDEQARWLETPTATTVRARRALYGLNRFVMRLVFGVQPLELAEANGPLVIAPNHTSFLDPFALAAALPSELLVHTHWGGWPGYAFRNALFRGLSHLLGVVPIDPDRALMSSLAFAAAVLEEERNLVWFPEGERSTDGELGEIRPGIGAILEVYGGVKVVPVAILGAFEAWPRDRRWPRRRRIDVKVGDPMDADALAKDGSGDSRRERIMDGLRRRMERMLSDDAASA